MGHLYHGYVSHNQRVSHQISGRDPGFPRPLARPDWYQNRAETMSWSMFISEKNMDLMWFNVIECDLNHENHGLQWFIMDYSDLSVQLNFYVDAFQVFAQGTQGSLHSFPIADLPKPCLAKLRRNDLFQTQPSLVHKSSCAHWPG